jgi:hypothetical protein
MIRLCGASPRVTPENQCRGVSAFAVQLYMKDGPPLDLPRPVMSARICGEALRLEGSVFAHPIIGRDAIRSILTRGEVI